MAQIKIGFLDLYVGLERHDYKTLSNTPCLKDYSKKDAPKIIRQHDYSKPLPVPTKSESTKGSRNPNPVAATRGSKENPSVPMRPPRKSYTSYSRSSTFDTIDEEGSDQPVKILIEDDSNPSGNFVK